MIKQSAFLLVLLVTTSLCLAQEKPKTGPRIKCDIKGWDFGVVNQGKRDQKKVKIHNVGDDVLRIGDIKVTCGCVQATMLKKDIPPGESRDLVLTLSTYRAHGVIRKHCYVYSNASGAKRPLVLTIDGEVKADWWIDKKQIQFGKLEAGVPYFQKFNIKSRTLRELNIQSIVSRNPNVEVNYKALHKPKVQTPHYEVTVTIKETLAPGSFADAIAVRVKGRQTPLMNVMIYARLSGPISIKPQKVFMGRIYFDQQARRVVKFGLEPGYTITGVTCSKPSMKAEISENPDGQSWDIALYVTGLESEPSMDESLTITSNHPTQPKVVVPVNWVSRPMRK